MKRLQVPQHHSSGKLMRRLQGRLQLLVMGAWQEGTADLHSLLHLLADTKVQRMGIAMGIGQGAVGQGEGKSAVRLQEHFVCNSCQGFLGLPDWPAGPSFGLDASCILEGTSHFAGLLLAPAEGFGLQPRFFTLIVLILGHFWCSVVTYVTFSSDLNDFIKNLNFFYFFYPEILKKKIKQFKHLKKAKKLKR